MDLFKRKPGLTLIALIWLVILLIPVWRQRAMRHWQTDILFGSGPVGANNEPLQLGLTAQGEGKLAKLYPDDPAVQLQLLRKPKEWTAPWSSGLSNEGVAVSTEDYNKEVVEHQKKLRTVNIGYFDRFAALVKRYPDSLFIRSQWLRLATTGSLVVEEDDLVKSYESALAPNGPPIVQPRNVPWLTKATTEKTLECARAGAKIEPDNAYWRWMEAIFCYSLRRDDEALAALRAAGKCTHFDDGCLDTAQRNLELMRRVQSCDTEDEVDALYGLLFPHYAPMRSATRQAMWNARKVFKRGDKAGAIEVADVIQKAALPVARSADFEIPRLVGMAIVHVGWRTVLDMGNQPIPASNPVHPSEEQIWERRHQFALNFARYTEQQGQPEIAKRALQTDAELRSLPRGFTKEFTAQHPELLSTERVSNTMMFFQALGYWLLKLAAVGIGLWLVTAPFSKRSGEVPATTRRLLVLITAFSTGITIPLLWWALENGAVQYINLFENQAPAEGNTVRAAIPAYLALAWAAPVALFTLAVIFAPVRIQMKVDNLTRWQFMLTVLSICGFYTVGMALTGPLENSITGQFWPYPLLLFWGCFGATAAIYIKKARATQKATVALLSATLVCWTMWLFLNASSRSGFADFTISGMADENIRWIGIAALVFAVLTVVAWIRGGGHKGITQNPAVASVQLHIRFVAATLAVGASLAYLGTNLVFLPIRAQIHHAVERQIEVGTFRYIEEELAKKGT